MVLVHELSLSTCHRLISLRAFLRNLPQRHPETLTDSVTAGSLSFIHPSQSFTAYRAHPCYKSHVDGPGVIFFTFIFNLGLREVVLWNLFLVCHLCVFICYLAGMTVFLAFSSSGHKKDCLVSFQTESFLLVFSHATFSLSMPSETFSLLGNVHVLWASHTASLNNFYAAHTHLTLLYAFSISQACLVLRKAIFRNETPR